MKILKIRFRSVDEVEQFVGIVSRYDGRMELREGNCQVDAKSILGIFSLDLSKTLSLCLYRPDTGVVDTIQRYVVAA